MISDLLDANRIRAGKGIPIEIDQCDLAEIADRVCEDLSTIHGDRFKREFQHPIEGYWSCRNIQRLLENLLTNGLKYGYATTPVTLRILERGESIEIAVHNYGDPIPPDERKRLFDPFIRSKAVESGEKKGWGLGLTLVRGVTEAHHGRVEVESSREAGTTFLVILPRDARKA
jgi:signal transduction histidine kinase